ncbi:MAG: endonuclease/exonuclease/phosphatase family protein [Polyangiaceae bacterium]
MTRLLHLAALAAFALASTACSDAWLNGSEPGDSGSGGTTSSTGTGAGTTSGGTAGGPEIEPGGAGGNQATVVSWNLREFPYTSTTLERAVELFEELKPDVVALQEVSEPSAFWDLVDALDDYKGVLNDDDADAYLRLGLLYRYDRVSLTDVETLFPGDWYPFPRPPLKAHVTIEGDTTIDFDIVNVHLKAKVDAESQQRREIACAELHAWVTEQLATRQEQDYVIVGDFNDRLLDPPGANVFDVFLDEPDTYAFLTLPLEEEGLFTYIPFEAMIDHVLVTSDTLGEVGDGPTEILMLDDAVSGYGAISDHRPVRTWLSW